MHAHCLIHTDIRPHQDQSFPHASLPKMPFCRFQFQLRNRSPYSKCMCIYLPVYESPIFLQNFKVYPPMQHFWSFHVCWIFIKSSHVIDVNRINTVLRGSRCFYISTGWKMAIFSPKSISNCGMKKTHQVTVVRCYQWKFIDCNFYEIVMMQLSAWEKVRIRQDGIWVIRKDGFFSLPPFFKLRINSFK